LRKYEDKITIEYQKALDAHIKSYQANNKFIKAKLQMSMKLLTIFNFNYAKVLVESIIRIINDGSLEGNMFSNSSNPLLMMCLVYELL
jgi:hypothetical protein